MFSVQLHYVSFIYNAKLIGDILLTGIFSYMSSMNQGIPRYVGCIIKNTSLFSMQCRTLHYWLNHIFAKLLITDFWGTFAKIVKNEY